MVVSGRFFCPEHRCCSLPPLAIFWRIICSRGKLPAFEFWVCRGMALGCLMILSTAAIRNDNSRRAANSSIQDLELHCVNSQPYGFMAWEEKRPGLYRVRG